jgi:hypothetical protein
METHGGHIRLRAVQPPKKGDAVARIETGFLPALFEEKGLCFEGSRREWEGKTRGGVCARVRR